MKKNKNIVLIGILLVGYFLTKKKVVEPPPTIPEYTPPPLPNGVLTIQEKLEALRYYADQSGLDWKLQKMSDVEIDTVYTYIFECRLLPKCIPSAALTQRIKLIKNKYQIQISI